MQCGGTQTRRQQEERRGGSPEGGAARGADAPRAPPSGDPPEPLLPSSRLRSDPVQGLKRSLKVTLTQTIPKR